MNPQDDRVWCIEQLIRKEGFLDNRMYECAQQCAISGRPETKGRTIYIMGVMEEYTSRQ